MYHLCTTAIFPAIHHKRKTLDIRLNIKDFSSVGVTGFEPATTRPAGVNPSFRAESRSSDFSFCDAFPIGISGLNVSRSTSVARDGCRNLQQRELFGSYTRFPFHPGAAKLRRAVGTLGEAKIRRIFQKAAFYGKKAATSRKDRRRRVADRAVGTGFRHSARCQPVVPWCSGQPPS